MSYLGNIICSTILFDWLHLIHFKCELLDLFKILCCRKNVVVREMNALILIGCIFSLIKVYEGIKGTYVASYF